MSVYSSKPWQAAYPEKMPKEINPQEYRSLIHLFDESCQKHADRIAFTNMGKSITFRELDRQCRDFAAFVQKELGFKKGDRLAIQLPNLLQYPIVMFGAMRAGAIIVNTNPLYTAREMEHQFQDSGAKAIVIAANFASKLEEVIHDTSIENVVVTELGDCLGLPKKWIVNAVVKHVKKMIPAYTFATAISFSEAMSRGAQLKLDPIEVTLDDLAFLQYTGGTTGVAKGAMLTHGNMVANMMQMLSTFEVCVEEGKEVLMTPLPLYHIFALVANCLGFVKMGCQNVLITNPKDLSAFEKEIGLYRPTVLTAVNTLFNALLNRESFRKMDHSRLKLSVGGGMAVQRVVSDRWHEVTGRHICEGYGLTEASPVLSVNPLDGSGRVGTIGLPVPNTILKIVDDQGQEVPQGERGEIWASGPQIMKGYWQRDEATREVVTEDGWLKTGDVGIMDHDGYFRIVDRKKEMILVSGFNVYPNEIEDVMAQHPEILEVACIGVPDDRSGEAVKVFIVKKNPQLTQEHLEEFCEENFTGYKKPKHFEFREELPKSNVGKVLRRILKEQETRSDAV